MLLYILAISSIVLLLGIFSAYGNFVVIWYIFPRFGKMNVEKSGNPDLRAPKVEAGNG
jgi:hypothetical protein